MKAIPTQPQSPSSLLACGDAFGTLIGVADASAVDVESSASAPNANCQAREGIR